MAANDVNTPQDSENNTPSEAENNSAIDQQAVSFDQMTSLSSENIRENIGQSDTASGGPARVDGAGNENIQVVLEKDQLSSQVNAETGSFSEESLAAQRQAAVKSNSTVSSIESDSSGEQIGVPFVDLTLPQGAIEANNQSANLNSDNGAGSSVADSVLNSVGSASAGVSAASLGNTGNFQPTSDEALLPADRANLEGPGVASTVDANPVEESSPADAPVESSVSSDVNAPVGGVNQVNVPPETTNQDITTPTTPTTVTSATTPTTVTSATTPTTVTSATTPTTVTSATTPTTVTSATTPTTVTSATTPTTVTSATTPTTVTSATTPTTVTSATTPTTVTSATTPTTVTSA
ncbi:MAG: hypothetical protein WC742_00005, partial [Gallionellaceae bacterium]